MNPLELLAAAFLVILAMVFTIRAENLADRREEEEAAARSIERAARELAPPEGAVKPAEPTYFVPDPTMPYDPPAEPVCIVQGLIATYADGGNAAIRPPAGRTQA